jgi:choline dehydrogenase-like flavoprotein
LLLKKGSSGKWVATGVEYIQDGAKKTVKAQNEVILSAGSFQTPQLLELSGTYTVNSLHISSFEHSCSGIGDSKVLQANGINVLHDLPGVGANLQDHLSTGFVAEMNPEYESMDVLAGDPARAGAEWQL